MLAAGATCAVWQPTPINGAAERARICFTSILEIDGRLSSGTNPQSFPSRYNKACDAYAIQFFFRILAGIQENGCLLERPNGLLSAEKAMLKLGSWDGLHSDVGLGNREG